MAKTRNKKPEGKRSKPKTASPLLAMAVFCERVLEEKDNVQSVIRVVDKLIVPKPPEQRPNPEGQPQPQFAVPITASVMFKSGDATGEYALRIEIVWPSGKRVKVAEATVTLLGDENGVNIRSVVPAPVDEEGLYWYDVFLDKRLVTRMPLRIAHLSPTSNPEATEQPQEPQQRGG